MASIPSFTLTDPNAPPASREVPPTTLEWSYADHADRPSFSAEGSWVMRGDCLEVLAELPKDCVDMVFVDPPYYMQLRNELRRPNNTVVDAVDDDWDQFTSWEDYDAFTRDWLTACRRVMKPTGTLWVIGSYHNIYRVGAQMQDLGFWTLNSIIWEKRNPTPHFRGVRFCNAHEELIWAARSQQEARGYTFHYQDLKLENGGKQMRSVWSFPICNGHERIKGEDGKKLHTTQKPLRLLTRIVRACTDPGDLVLDPFAGTGTTGEAALRLGRRFFLVEREAEYVHQGILPRLRWAAEPQERKAAV